jgi:hypothetical protein
MTTPTTHVPIRKAPALLGLRRVLVTVLVSLLVAWPVSLEWKSGTLPLLWRVVVVGLSAMVMFGVFERWPRRLPYWLARWPLQVAGVALAIPLTAAVIWMLSTDPGAPPFWEVRDRLGGFGLLVVPGLLLAPWVALTALVRQKDALARHQALAFDLERSELERRALDARLRLLQAQVEPHFLFNTLANVRALVATGSAQAPAVLDSLIAYLRAAVPRLHEPATTLGQELDLVQAYLEVMHMRIPDRLQFALQIAPGARRLRCPPMSLLTLVENAVRHGIDPGEEGGRIDIAVEIVDGRCRVRVSDTGVGLGRGGSSLGTGLATLRERLQLSFSGDAQLRIASIEPHGVSAEMEFPAQTTDVP